MLPAHHTKHVPVLDVRIGEHAFRLSQSDKGDTNGTALWLGGQLLSVYLLSLHATGKLERKQSADKGRLRAIELGSGIGLCGFVTPGLPNFRCILREHSYTQAHTGFYRC
jgi:protein N-lysine methyltransferase METTL21D